MDKGFTELKVNNASCNLGSEAVLQRGSVSMMCTPRFHSWYLEQGLDQELGRWTWMRFKGNDYYNLVVIMVCQVGQKTHSGLGMETTYHIMPRWRKLRPMHSDNCNPHQQFLVDFSRQIELFPSQGDEIILMMDANLTSTMLNLLSLWKRQSKSSWQFAPDISTCGILHR